MNDDSEHAPAGEARQAAEEAMNDDSEHAPAGEARQAAEEAI
jgi:hypothetical protein